MKNQISFRILVLSISFLFSVILSADEKLGTDFRFSDSVVQGRYQTPEGAMATVEDEKVLQVLFSVRTHFKDRIRLNLKKDGRK